MADANSTQPPPSPPATKRRRRPSVVVMWGLGVSIAAALGVVAAFTWLASQHALDTVLDMAVAQSNGRLAFDGARGTLTGQLEFARIAWADGAVEIVAEDVVLRFSPAHLLYGQVNVNKATVRRVAATLPHFSDAVILLADSIAPPLSVDVDRLAVETIDWRQGTRSGTLSGATLAYAGNSRGHRLSEVRLTAQGASLAGEVSVGARRPYPVDARVALDLAAPHPAGRVEAVGKGSLEALVVEATSTLAGVDARARIDLTPLAAQSVVGGRIEARALDLAALDRAWPATRLDVVVDARPAPGGYAGRLEARNAIAGTIDAGRVPLARVASSFALRGRVLELTALEAQLPGGGSLAGSGTVALDGWRNRWKLAVTGLDLAQIHTSLHATKLAGRMEADVERGVQRVSAEVAQDDLQLAFDARYDGATLVAERFAAQARGSSLSGSGRIALAGARPFAVDARAQRFDPSRFGAFPPGSIDATIHAEGTAAPAPVVQVDATFAEGSRLAGLPLQGRVRGRVAEAYAEAIDARLTLGSSRIAVSGAVQRKGEALAIEFASSRLAEFAPLLPDAAPKLAGSLDARVRLQAGERGTLFTVEVRGEKLRVDEYAIATLRANGRGLHDAPLASPSVDAISGATLELAATGLAAPGRRLDRVQAVLAGSAAAHTFTLAATLGNQSVQLGGRGGAADLASAPRWRGSVQALAAGGIPGLERVVLVAPVDVELARDRVVVGALQLAGGGAQAEVDGFTWREGQLDTRGRFRGVAVAPFARAAGLEVRWPMNVVLGGRWDLASAPQWRGTIAIERESGDVEVDDPGSEGGARIALGLQTLRLEARIDGPRLAASGELRAKLAGNTLVDAVLTAPADALHPFGRDSVLGGTVRAHLPSLASLQPWIGTSARVQGQAIAEANLAGTLGAPAFSGQLVGYALRLDMPQYGINLADGRLRIVGSPEGLRLEELVLAGGAGRFSATGTIALPRERGGAAGATSIAWRAENFRALNHPDRRLVVDGEGTIAREGGRWLLAGRLAADEGVIAHRATSDTELADDIVVVGRPRAARTPSDVAGLDAPLDVELAIELGRDFRISAEGLDTRLAGKLQLSSHRGEPLAARGTIRTVRGTYQAFGQRLDIDRGRLIFDGPVANPALDIVALRKNLAVEAGVEITGTVRAPVVRLTSNPPVPDSEKLSWLLTGGPPGSASQRELVALQAAQAALAGRDGRTVTQRFAQGLGIDDIAILQRGRPTNDDPLAGQVVAIGKRISDRLFVAFEQGLEIATHALRIEYVLSRYFTVSAFAGTTSGVELRFRRNW